MYICSLMLMMNGGSTWMTFIRTYLTAFLRSVLSIDFIMKFKVIIIIFPPFVFFLYMFKKF